MTFDWNSDTIRWYKNANAYTGFYQNVAKTVTPMMDGYQSMCDIGCGLGLVDLELSAVLEKIDCIDISKAALSSLKADAGERGITNIYTRQQDCNKLEGRWDVIYMSFFGSRELDRFLPLCKKLIAVVGVTSQSEIIPSKHRNFRKNTVENTIHFLKIKNIAYRLTNKTLEFGQPFLSLDDARSFILSHSAKSTAAEIDEFLSARLVRMENAAYPYYLPRPKPIGIFELNGTL